MQAIRASSALKAAAVRPARSVAILPSRFVSRSVIARAAEDDSAKQMAEMQAKAQETLDATLKPLAAEWEKTPEAEKPAAIAIIFFVVVAQIAIGATIDTIDKIPIVNSALEFIGIIVAAGFGYKLVTEPEERTALQENLDSFVKAVKGQ